MELKRCPFCGGRAEFRSLHRHDGFAYDCFVMCTRCAATGNNYMHADDAAKAWNERVHDALCE